MEFACAVGHLAASVRMRVDEYIAQVDTYLHGPEKKIKLTTKCKWFKFRSDCFVFLAVLVAASE